MTGLSLFSIPDLISDWRNANLLHKAVTVFGLGATALWIGFSFTAGTFWGQGAPFLVGLGHGLDAGAASLCALCIFLGIPVAYPKAKIDEIA
ncbi:MAG: hypothetical protein M3P27_09680, partial [Acidobacteriota bacterium]|nr:hypothetical protein [Acidobacteriota bacterium]